MNFPTGRFPVFFSVATNLVDTEIFILKPIEESPPMSAGRGDSEKFHTAHKRSRLRANWQWKELDCCNSSDALLMNIFCHPEVLERSPVRALLGIESKAVPEFGFKPRTPLLKAKRDNTEIDMKLGELLVEAKLTESNFQFASVALISRYRDLEEIFDVSELPTRNGKQGGYQLIRGTLAAYRHGLQFLCSLRCSPSGPN